MNPRKTPCSICPYRIDCESGIWHREEYEKLPRYDAETGEQPTGVFLCHTDQHEMCRGWLDTHDKRELLSLRLAISLGNCSPDIMDLPPGGVAVFESGAAACRNGIAKLDRPSEKALKAIRGLTNRRSRKKSTKRGCSNRG